MPAPVLIIANPAGGSGSALDFLRAHVLPLLDVRAVPYELKTTEGPGHAGELAVDFLDSLADPEDAVTLVLGGGDGTVHEVVNALVGNGREQRTKGKRPEVRLVLLPLGTANALYSSFFPPSESSSAPSSSTANDLPHTNGDSPAVAEKLRSLASFLSSSAPSSSSQGHLRPLTLSKTSFNVSSALTTNGSPEPIISCVVTSTCLHASILHDAESLRSQYPGVERFKHAAAQNLTRWYAVRRATLLPLPFLGVQRYDPSSEAFVSRQEAEFVNEPLAYFLSTVNIDRLEPKFAIAPLSKLIPPVPSSMDILLIRPRRDPSVGSVEDESARKRFAEKAMKVMGAAYEEGRHVGLRYDEDGALVYDGEGSTVVEYFRCAGWEWEPAETDERAHLVCADGTIVTIPKGGRARCRILSEFEQGRILVWV